MTMYDKFNQLLETNNVTPYRIHKETGISTATLSDWKNGKSEPKKDKIQKICNFFNVPISYFYDDNTSDFSIYEIIKELCKKKGVTVTGTEKELGFARGSLCKVDTSKPSMEKVQKLADYFGVSVSYLMTGKNGSVADIYTDDHDIKKHIDIIMESLDGQSEIVYEGQKVDLNEQSRRMLRYAMEIAYEAAKNNILNQENKDNKDK